MKIIEKSYVVTRFEDMLDKESNSLLYNLNVAIIWETWKGKTALLKDIAINLVNSPEEQEIIIVDSFDNYKDLEWKVKILNINEGNKEDILNEVSTRSEKWFKTVLIDEAHNFLGKSEDLDKKFDKMIRESRNKKIRYIVAVQNKKDIPGNLIDIFRTIIELD